MTLNFIEIKTKFYSKKNKLTTPRSENNLASILGKLLHLAIIKSYIERKTVSKSLNDGSNLIPSSFKNILTIKPKRKKNQYPCKKKQLSHTAMFIIFN